MGAGVGAMSLIGKSIGNYRITAKLGEGGMGAVYLGEHPLIGKKVAVKVLLDDLAAKEEIVTRFFNEAKAVNDIGHANIVDIVDFGKTPNDQGTETVYFIMEFLDGESLSSRLHSVGTSAAETIHILSQSCSALAASHKKGIVHRDLKPENLYLCPRAGDKNFVKILDFGIAKLTGDGGGTSKTRTGLVIGTPAYMSPEQCEGRGLVDHRSDIYSLGVLMYEMLTGRLPFIGEGFGEVLVMHLTQAPDRPSLVNPNVTPELEAIALHALEKDRNRRFQNMDEFGQALADPAAHLAAWGQQSHLQPTMSGKAGASQRPTDERSPRGPITSTTPVPTTLSGAASEVATQEPRRSRAPVFVTAGLGVVVALAGVGFVLTRGAPKAAVVLPPPPVEAPKVVKDEMVTITVASDPPGAKIIRAGEGEVGITPKDLKVKKSDASFDLQIRLDGYRMAKSEVLPDKDKEIHVSLAREAAPPPVAAPAAEAAPAEAAPAVAKVKIKKPRTPTVKPAGVPQDPDIGIMEPDFLRKSK